MIRCGKCGTVNEANATFCSQCDAFLEWSGQRIEGGDAPETAAAKAAPPYAPETATAKAAPPAEAPRSRKPEKGETTPVRKAKPQPSSVPEPPAPGQVVCGACGTGNDRDRRFCRRCGAAIGPVAAPAPPPQAGRPGRRSSWLSRIVRRGKREGAGYPAGERPAAMSSPSGRWRPGSTALVFGLLALFGLGALASYLYVPAVHDSVHDVVRTVQRRLIHPEEVRAISAEGQARAGFPAANLIDGGANSYWVGSRNQNERWVVVFEFQRPTDLLQINFDGGADGAEYERLGRPFKFRLRTSDKTSEVADAGRAFSLPWHRG